MKEFKKILVPTDFSEKAAEAYPFAENIAEKFDAQVDFIHIIPMSKYFNESIKKLGVPFDMEDDLFPHVQERAREQLIEIMEEEIDKKYRGEDIVQIHRKPSEAIVEFAHQGDYDLILMGAKGEHAQSILRGSVTEKVIRHSRVPVLSIEGEWPKKGIRHILMPTDTSELSYFAFPWVISLAHSFEADITVLNVLELYGSLSENIPHEPGETEIHAIYEDILEHLQGHFDEHDIKDVEIERGSESYEDQLVVTINGTKEKVPLHTRIDKGVSAHAAIEEYAQGDLDIVVMATHGRTGLAHVFLGSTTENVAKYVRKPVLTIRPPRKKFE